MPTLFPNVWHLRTVADSAAKACLIDYKPTTRVLVTEDSKDFFYVCPGHLTDRGFASPILDPEVEAAKAAAAEKQREIEAVIAEYEEKQRKKKAKKKDKIKEDDKDKEKKKEDEKKANDDDEKERDEKIKAIEASGAKSAPTADDDGPRVFALQKSFYQMRLDRKRNLELSKQNQQRMRDPSFFPSAPKTDLP